MATQVLTEVAPNVIMATSLLNLNVRNYPRECISGVHVLTTSEDINHYPECKYSELVNLANHFGWIIFPLSLWDWKATINTLAKEDLAYAWDVYQAQLRFREIVGDDNDFYMMAPASFMNEDELGKNFDNMFANIYFPPSEKEYRTSLSIRKDTLCKMGDKLREEEKKLAEAEEKNDSSMRLENPRNYAITDAIFGLSRDYFHGKMNKEELESAIGKLNWIVINDPIIFSKSKSTDNIQNVTCRIGCCFGEPIPDYLVNDLPKYDNSSVETIVFPFLPKKHKNDGKNDELQLEKYTLLYDTFWNSKDLENIPEQIDYVYPKFRIKLEYMRRKREYRSRRQNRTIISCRRLARQLNHRKPRPQDIRSLNVYDEMDMTTAELSFLRTQTEEALSEAFIDFRQLWDKKEFHECLKFIAVFKKIETIYQSDFPAVGCSILRFKKSNPEFWAFYKLVSNTI